MVDDVFKVMQNIAKEKKISLNNNVRDEVLMKANINRMKQLIMNLVDNGIKYNVQTARYRLTVQGGRKGCHFRKRYGNRNSFGPYTENF